MTLDWFVDEVHKSLSLLGLPLNWQPNRSSIIVFFYRRQSIRQCVNYYKSQVIRYENYVNKENLTRESLLLRLNWRCRNVSC